MVINNKITLDSGKSVSSVNSNKSLVINFEGNKRMLPVDPMETTINEVELYNSERKACNNIRLTVEINPICSNVLFNNITEIVRNEGTDYVQCLNYDDLNEFTNDGKYGSYKWDSDNLKFKLPNDFGNGVVDAIRDTQLSNEANGFVYHCGLDMFNNHYLRSKTFKTICPMNGNNSDFNTIRDLARDYEGKQIQTYRDRKNASSKKDIDMHVYLNEEVLTYKETVSNKLTEENGWLGFINSGKMNVYAENDDKYDWFKAINNKKSCDFVDMYPERDLFYFNPKYNSFKRRIEKNWHYCLTYPSSSTTEVSFIKKLENGTTSLKVLYFDDTINSPTGIDAIKFWSVSKHGLDTESYVNVYKGEECVLLNAKVSYIVDDYTFYVFRNGLKLSNKWFELEKGQIGNVDIDGNTYEISSDRNTFTKNDGTVYYFINNEKVNIDDSAQDISFKRVVEGVEVDYYVRIFSKIPNWKFAKKKPTEDLIFNKEDDSFLKTYQHVNNDFESHLGKLAYSRNVYNDNIAEVVFTDTIDISLLKDNLGRPISEIFFTVLKNNEGYREWYGKEGFEHNISKDNVEYSHCFGKLNCAFKLFDGSIYNKNYENVTVINNLDGLRTGLTMETINERGQLADKFEDDEIQYMPYEINGITYSGDSSFYGDLCCYSSVLQDEMQIQYADFRFNTAQRELKNGDVAYNFMKDITYDEIIGDDLDESEFTIKTDTFINAVSRKEGYYYQPHYKIRIKSFDVSLTTIYPKFLTCKTFEYTHYETYENTYKLFTMEEINLCEKSIINIYDKDTNKNYYGEVVCVENGRNVILSVSDINGNKDFILNKDKKNYRFFIKPENVPNYATLANDGSCRYIYRELHQNGFDENTDIETYPFTSNHLYINKLFNLYLKRQNPNNLSELRSKVYPYDVSSVGISFEKINKYYSEEDITC